jgi:benzoyl-CoA-dihydrodiol lyase
MAESNHPIRLGPGDPEWVEFVTHPDRYIHLRLEVDGPVAWIRLDIQEEHGHRADDYLLKLNSYDISVDVELNDAVQRLRFEHPEVACVVITSALDGVFSAGANIFMLQSASHSFKVNFCKYTNETRLYIEEATADSGQTYIAACNGVASGGGYELPLACEEIYLIDDRRSAVSLPEIPFLGVLPGTGGLTRVVDKRNIRRDRADVFVTLAEGLKGRRAVEWGFVDAAFPGSKFDEAIANRCAEIAQGGHPDRRGVALPDVEPTIDEEGLHYEFVDVRLGPVDRAAVIEIRVPDDIPAIPDDPTELGGEWWALKAFRELDNALLHLRFHYRDVGLLLLQTRGQIDSVLALDEGLLARQDHWFVREVMLHMRRVLKRLDITSKSAFALIDEGSCFAGSLFELTLAADRSYMLEEDGVEIALSGMNAGPLPMGNGLTRLQTRFLHMPEHAQKIAQNRLRLAAEDVEELGLATEVMDELDWEDEIRIQIEERVSMSPDALTGMEASIRFAGPETMETKIFGRLSAWQNWCFQRPNAVGPRGALKLYGDAERPEFDWERT